MAVPPAQAKPHSRLWDFDIDVYLNPFVPSSQLYRLPKPVRHFLGYRDGGHVAYVSNLAIWSWALLGGFGGIALIGGVFRAASVLQSHHPPIIIGSFGAAAILEYHSIESPLAQPRNAFIGQLISATVGVAITKLFLLMPDGEFDNYRWVAGALAVGVSSFLMGVTKTIHPPAGATALMAATDDGLTGLGWYLLPLVLLGNTLMLASACVVNNIQRRFPQHWWTAANLRAASKEREASALEGGEIRTNAGSGETTGKSEETVGFEEIRITADQMSLPPSLEFSDEEWEVLKLMQSHLATAQQIR